MRRSVYPRFISKGKLTEEKAAFELAAMQAVLETLLAVQGAAPRRATDWDAEEAGPN